MYYKEYGNTGLKVSAIGLGTLRYNMDDVHAGNYEKCAEIPLYAFEKGINYWDTAPDYCEDKSEMITGIALSQVDRSKVFVTSKTNLQTLGTEKPTKDQFRKRLEMSLDRLKTDYIDFYHMWCMMNMESWQKHMETMYGFFEDAKREGLIRNIAVSSHMQGDDNQVVVDSGKFCGMLIGYNALNYRFRQSGVKKAYEKGMGIVVMNPLSGGLIPQRPEAFEYLTEGTDLTVPQAALRFVASHREISVVLAGCTTKQHVDDAVKAVENLEEFPAETVAEKFGGEHMMANDLCTGCGYCKGCPMGLEIPKFMDGYNQKLMTGSAELIPTRLRIQWEYTPDQAAACIGCGACEKKCTQHLPIIERMREIASLAKEK